MKLDSQICLMQELSNIAQDLGLDYGLEVVNRYETNLLNTAYQVNFHLPSVCD